MIFFSEYILLDIDRAICFTFCVLNLDCLDITAQTYFRCVFDNTNESIKSAQKCLFLGQRF